MSSRGNNKKPGYLTGKEIKARFRPHGLSDNTDELTLSAGQRQVVGLELGAFARVIGAPQSGKTTALKALFLKLAREARPESILVFTANRTAAATLRDELALAYQGASLGPMARSISSLAFAILREQALNEKKKLPELITGSEQDAMIENILEDVAEEVSAEFLNPMGIRRQSLALAGFRAEMRDLISNATEHGVTPEELESLADEHRLPQWKLAAMVYRRYLEGLSQSYNTYRHDPASLIVNATRLIRAGHMPVELQSVRQILLDDAQELTPASVDFITALSERGAGVVLFGDPDVATLGFRSADPEAMTRLISALAARAGQTAVNIDISPEHQTHSPQIASALSRVTSRIDTSLAGKQRKSTAVQAANVDEEIVDPHVVAGAFALQSDEHAWLAYQLRKEHLENGVQWRDMAVVARSTQELIELENALSAESVPVRLIGAKSALKDEFAASHMLKLLESVLSTAPITFERASELLQSPIGLFDAISMRRLRQRLRAVSLQVDNTTDSKTLVCEMFSAEGALIDIEAPITQQAENFLKLFFKLRSMVAEGATIEDLLWQIYDHSTMSKQWPKLSTAPGEVAAQLGRNLDSVVALFSAAARYVERNPLGKPQDFVTAQLELKLPEDSVGVGANLQHRVSLLTPSGLIGRSFKVVALAHMQEGIWPNLRPRSTLLASNLLDEYKRTGVFVTANEMAARSEMTGELRMLAKSVGSATDKLYVSAITTEEEQQSQFLELLVQRQIEPVDFDSAPLTLRAVVGQLRRRLLLETNQAERNFIAAQLLRLADAGIPGAHPDQWYGSLELSTTEPLATLGLGEKDKDRLTVKPSQLADFIKCPLHWFINAHGGGDNSFTTRVGTLVHEAFEKVEANSVEDYMKYVDANWGQIEFDSKWQQVSEQRRARQMLSNLLAYVDKFKLEGGTLVGSELPFVFNFHGAYIKGTVDRIEIQNGEVRILDVKTSKYPVTKDATEAHPQLAAYQMAVIHNGFDEKHASLNGVLSVERAQLLEVGLDKGFDPNKPKAQTSFTADPAHYLEMQQKLEEVIEGMLVGNHELTAQVGTHCTAAHSYGSCEIHLVDQVTYGN